MLQKVKHMATLLCAVFLLPGLALAQTGIQGTVIDSETEEELVGATVLIQETEQGQTTGPEGDFEIDNVEPGTYTVRVTFVGYETYETEVEITQDQLTSLEIELRPEELGLDELVVTGYAVQERREVTGSISSVRGEDFRGRSISSPDQALQGRSSGVQVVGQSGQPGAAQQVRIRGFGSLTAGNDPLVIVDGVQMDNSGPDDLGTSTHGAANFLSSINPADIESMEILKDAEATAIYGAQGSNGVILITTRRGHDDQTEFTVSSQLGVNEQVDRYDLLDSEQWLETMQEAYANRAMDLGNDPETARQDVLDDYGLGVADPSEAETYDWQDAMLQSGIVSRVQASAQGGSDNTRFFISGGYLNHEGSVVGTNHNRLNLRTNLDHDFSDFFTLETNVSITRSLQEGAAEGGNFINSPFHGGVLTRPNDPIFLDDGSYNPEIRGGISYNNLQVLEEREQIGNTLSIVGNIAGDFTLTDNLSFRSSWGVDHRNVFDRSFDNPSILQYLQNHGGGITESNRRTTNWNTNQVFNYRETFDDVHTITGTLGGEYREQDLVVFNTRGEGLPSPAFSTLALTANPTTANSTVSSFKLGGVFSRLQYNYDQRYFVTGNVRYDGSSRFGADNQWGLFYSGALAWDAAQEDFLDIESLNQMRIRVSYGISGNADIDNFASRTLYGQGGSYEANPGVRPQQLGNPDLGWEQARTVDLGIDWALFDHRLYGEVDVYQTDNENLLLDAFLPGDSGYNDITENVGTVRNRGIEIDIGGIVVDRGNFVWNTEFNISFLDNEIVELADGQETIDQNTRLGEPYYVWWGPEYAGVNSSNGRAMWYDEDGEITYNPGASDNTVLGSYLPDYYGGWANSFTFGNFEADIFFQYDYGADLFNHTVAFFLADPSRNRNMVADVPDNAWSEPGDETDVPRLYSQNTFPGGGSNRQLSSRNIEDGSYIRLKNITLSYQVPPRLVEAIGISGARVFAQGENLATWSEFSGIDPEAVERTQGNYPQARQILGGIEVNF